jgi:hypothetical protein
MRKDGVQVDMIKGNGLEHARLDAADDIEAER